jgi:hypothetical protein
VSRRRRRPPALLASSLRACNPSLRLLRHGLLRSSRSWERRAETSDSNFKQRGYALVFSRRNAPELCISFTLLQNRGRRESRMPIAPAVVRTKSARVDHRFNRITPAFPARMVYGLLRALPGDRLVCHRRLADRRYISNPVGPDASPQDLTPASGRQDHATSPSATISRQRSCRASCGPASSGEGGFRRRSSARRPIAHGKTRPAIPMRARRCRVHRIPPRVRDDSRSAPPRVGRASL